jgi:hypothetical protein
MIHLLTSMSYSIYMEKPTGDPEKDRLNKLRYVQSVCDGVLDGADTSQNP